MQVPDWLQIAPAVRAALAEGLPVVALESTLISHGLPYPDNLRTAEEAEAAVRSAGAVPATIAVIDGSAVIGIGADQIERLARPSGVLKAGRRDLAYAITDRRTAATTVSATMFLANRAGIAIFATGGIGGAHRGCADTYDISADLIEFGRTPTAIVCAGAKSILDLPKTLEILETNGVPVCGFRTDRFPAFYVRESALPTSCRVDTPTQAAALIETHRQCGGTGILIVQPIAERYAVEANEFEQWMTRADKEAVAAGISGPSVTPFLLRRIAEYSCGRTLIANRKLIVANARTAAEIAVALADQVRA